MESGTNLDANSTSQELFDTVPVHRVVAEQPISDFKSEISHLEVENKKSHIQRRAIMGVVYHTSAANFSRDALTGQRQVQENH
jgi:hypothetical protein